MISEKSVQEIIDTAKIEDIVGEYVTLKRAGSNLKGLCPFHNEKTPSFSVSPSKNIFKCFGCGKGGNPVQFLMEHEQMSFPDALRHLAKRYNIEIEETTSSENQEERQHKDSLFLINEYAKKYFQEQLLETDRGRSVGLSYFKDRGFREETIRKFGLGYAPQAKNAFTLQAVNAGYKAELLQKLGLTTSYGSDFFRDRVQFCIHNLSGKVIGFGGRILDKTKKAPKYINSPETEIYNKSRVLYGAYFAKKAIRKQDECILVEGYTDVISLHQAGIENVVASSGTSLTVEQIQLVKRFTPNMKILYDGDQAGIKAALRGLDLVLEQDMNVRIVLLPEGEDPDSYLQRVGPAAFESYIDKEAKDFILFKSQKLMEEAEGDPIKKAQLIKSIVDSIARIPDPVKRSLYVKECANLVKVEEEILVVETNKAFAIHNRKRRQEERRKPYAGRTASPPPPSDGLAGLTASPYANSADEEEAPNTAPNEPAERQADGAYQERDVIRLLIASGGEILKGEAVGVEGDLSVAAYILGNLEDVIDDFDNKQYEKVAKDCLNRLAEGATISQQYFLHHKDQSISQLAVELLHPEFDYSPNWVERWDIPLQTQPMPELNFTNDTIQSINLFKLRKIVKLCAENQERLKTAGESGNMEEMQKILMVQQKLLQIRQDLAKEFGGVVILK
ncbi:MAG: DNA primase [Bacteroidota bacterium]